MTTGKSGKRQGFTAFKKEELREALEACVDTDEAVKSGRLNDTMGVELLIVRYSSGVNKNSNAG